MGRKYHCDKCGGNHEAPVGEKCQLVIGSTDGDKSDEIEDGPGSGGSDGGSGGGGSSAGSLDMTKLFQTLDSISNRLDRLEKPETGNEGIGNVGNVHVSVGSQASGTHENMLNNAGKTLNSLLNGNSAGPETLFDKDKFDPRCMLTVKAKSTKAVHISQFLHEGAKRRRQNMGRNSIVVDTNENKDQLIFHADDQHPYAHISVSEWGAANCRLLNYLLQEGQIKRPDIEYYLAYTAKIHDLAEKFEWQSILAYDYEYRELQAEFGFNWGISNPHLEIQVLVPRQKLKPNFQNKQPTEKKEQAQIEECKLMLAHGYCRFGDKCRYKHTKPDEPPRGPP